MSQVLQTYLVQICEINIDTQLSVLLLYYHNVYQPIGVKNFLDCPRVLELVHLFFYCIKMLL